MSTPAPVPTREQLTALKGLSSNDLCDILYGIAAKVPADYAIVEIGVFRGRTACWLGAGAKSGRGATVYAVDPWDLPGERYPFQWMNTPEFPHRKMFIKPETREAAFAAVRTLGLDNVQLIQSFSQDVARQWTGPKIAFLFVDGNHEAEHVRGDFAAWAPHLLPGAVIAWDDHDRLSHPDVPRVIDELLEEGRIKDFYLKADRLALTKFVR